MGKIGACVGLGGVVGEGGGGNQFCAIEGTRGSDCGEDFKRGVNNELNKEVMREWQRQ